MLQTTNFLLKKPEVTDNADLLLFVGDNMDIIESALTARPTLTEADGRYSAIGHIHTEYAGVNHSHSWAEITDKPITFTPNLMSNTTVGGARVGNGLAMSGEYLYINTGTGLLVDTTNYTLAVDPAHLDNNYVRLDGSKKMSDTLHIESNTGGAGARERPLLRLSSYAPSLDLHDLSGAQTDFPLRIENDGNNLYINVLNFDYTVNEQLMRLSTSTFLYKGNTIYHAGNISGASVDHADKAIHLPRYDNTGSQETSTGYLRYGALGSGAPSSHSGFYIAYKINDAWWKLKAGDSDRLGGVDASQFLTRTGAWIEATLQNGWLNYGAPFGTAGYIKDNDGFVTLKGFIRAGSTGVAAFVLPSGYRPISNLIIIVPNYASSGVQAGRVDITTTGSVMMHTHNNNGWISLENIRFRSE